MKYMLDTNILIYAKNNKPSIVREKLLSLNPNDVCISVISYSELLYGVQKSQHPETNMIGLHYFLIPFEIIPFDKDAAIQYGIIRAELEKSGNLIGNNDLLIAAHALSNGYTLVTNNAKEFSRVKGLKIENWVDD